MNIPGRWEADTTHDAYIIKHYKTKSDPQIAADLGVPFSKIRNRRRYLNLIKDREAWLACKESAAKNYKKI